MLILKIPLNKVPFATIYQQQYVHRQSTVFITMSVITSIVGGTMSIITSIVAGTIKLVCCVGVCGACYAAYTKPSKKSFIAHMKTKNPVAGVAISAINWTTDAVVYKDYLFFATVTVADSTFLGLCNNWIS